MTRSALRATAREFIHPNRIPTVAAFIAILGGCGRNATTEPRSIRSVDYGEEMSLVGRRFELVGKAVTSDRFELAAFEIDELGEIFAGALRSANLPKEGPTAHLDSMATAFAEQVLPGLAQAARTRDRKSVEEAFEHTSEACNDCHQASKKAFIVVPHRLGADIPDVAAISPPKNTSIAVPRASHDLDK
jgi:hypothetical protein